MGENAEIVRALGQAPRWMVTQWGRPGGTARVSIVVADTVAHVTVHDGVAMYDGRRAPLARLAQLLQDVQHDLDARALAMPVAADATIRLADLWRTTPEDRSGQWSLRHGRIEWHCTDRRLHVEAGDGGPYDQPLVQPLVDMLVDVGWKRPDHNFRNCWLQPAAEDLDSAAGIAVLTTMTAFGYPEPPTLP